MEESGHPSHHSLTAGSDPGSPVGSRSSGTTSVAGIFLRKQRKLINAINALKSNPMGQPDTLKTQASLLKDDLKNLGVLKIVEKYESDPNFLDHLAQMQMI